MFVKGQGFGFEYGQQTSPVKRHLSKTLTGEMVSQADVWQVLVNLPFRFCSKYRL